MPAETACSASSFATSGEGGAGGRVSSSTRAVVRQPGDPLDALGLGVPLEAVELGDALGEQLEQPLGLDLAGEAHHHASAALLGVDGHHQLGVVHHRHRVEGGRAAAGDQQLGRAWACAASPPGRGTPRAPRGAAPPRSPRRSPAPGASGPPAAPAACARARPTAARRGRAAARAGAERLGLLEALEQLQHVGGAARCRARRRRPLQPRPGLEANVALAQQRRHRRALLCHAAPLGLHHQPAEARVDGEAQQPPPDVAERTALGERAEPRSSASAASSAAARAPRRRETRPAGSPPPRGARGPSRPGRCDESRARRTRPRLEVGLGVEAQALARAGAAGAARRAASPRPCSPSAP